MKDLGLAYEESMSHIGVVKIKPVFETTENTIRIILPVMPMRLVFRMT